MENLLQNTDSIFDNILNYFLIEESGDLNERYTSIEKRMKKKIYELKCIIDESLDCANRDAEKIVKNFFVTTSSLMDLSFEFFNIYYKRDKKTNKYDTFIVKFKDELLEHEYEIANLSWYKDIVLIRNEIIHESKDVIILHSERLEIQKFDEYDYPMILSDLMVNNYYIDFTLLVVDILNKFIHFLKIIFNSVVKDKAVNDIDTLRSKAKKFTFFNLEGKLDSTYNNLFEEVKLLRDSNSTNYMHDLKYFKNFKANETVLMQMVDELERGDYRDLPCYYKGDLYFQLSKCKYLNEKYSEGIDLLWKGYEYNKDTSFISNIIYGMTKLDVVISKELIFKMDKYIEDYKFDAFRNEDYSFFITISNYYEKSKNLEKALEMLKMGMGMSPFFYHPTLYFNYAQLNKRIGKYDIALNAYKKVIEQEPKDYESYAGIVHCLINLNQVDNLVDTLITILKYFPLEKDAYQCSCFLIKKYPMQIGMKLIPLLKEAIDKKHFGDTDEINIEIMQTLNSYHNVN